MDNQASTLEGQAKLNETSSGSDCENASAVSVVHGQELKIPGQIQIYKVGNPYLSPTELAVLKRRFALIRKAERIKQLREAGAGRLTLKQRKKLLARSRRGSVANEFAASLIAAVVIVLISVGLAGTAQHYGKAARLERNAEVRSEGARAFASGVSAEANPYQGTRDNSTNASLWLDGWINAKAGAK